MAETNEEPRSQTPDPELNPLTASKRKLHPESLDEREGEQDNKHQKPDVAPDEDDGRDEVGENASDPIWDRNADVDEGKGVPTAVDKGKGIMVEEDEGEEDEDDDQGSDDSSDVGSGDEFGGERDDDSDFDDDPLAEVEIENILPSRTRRRDPPPLGAFFDPNQYEDDSDDSE